MLVQWPCVINLITLLQTSAMIFHNIDQQHVLECPVCKNNYVQFVGFKSVQSKKICITLDFECENGHNFSSFLHNSQGFTVSEISTDEVTTSEH